MRAAPRQAHSHLCGKLALTAPAAEPKLLYAATGSTPPPKLVFEAPVFVTFESDGLGNTAVGSVKGGFAIEHKVAATPAACARDDAQDVIWPWIFAQALATGCGAAKYPSRKPVSYTHLTLPTKA